MARYDANPTTQVRTRRLIFLGILIAVILLVTAFARGWRPFGGEDADADIAGSGVVENEFEMEPELPAADNAHPVAMPVIGEVTEELAEADVNTIDTNSVAAVVDPNLSQINPQASELISQAQALLAENPAKLIDARTRLNEALLLDIPYDTEIAIKQQMAKLSEEWLFSSKVDPLDSLCSWHKVQPGELLSTIGKKYNIPYEIIMQINNIERPELLKAEARLKVINGPFHLRVYRSKYRADLYLQDTYVKSFNCGLGVSGHDTPTGLWLVDFGGKMIKPTWTDPDSGKTYHADDPDYPLGSRWIGLKGLEGNAVGRQGFALHGTKDEASIGTSSSRGCIRFYNGNIIELYNMLDMGSSKVRIFD